MLSLTYQQSVFKRYYSDRHFSEFSPKNQKSTGIDVEQITSLSLYVYSYIQSYLHSLSLSGDKCNINQKANAALLRQQYDPVRFYRNSTEM